MKKIPSLLIILVLIIVGVFFSLSINKERTVANFQTETELTEGQRQKLELIMSLKFENNLKDVILTTNLLQSLCSTYSIVELKFKALNVAFSGQQPLISHSFSCAEIQQNNDLQTLNTSIENIKSLQKNPLLKNELSQLTAHGLYSDEELPNEWQLFEIVVSGKISFSITEAELAKFLGTEFFKFSLTTF